MIPPRHAATATNTPAPSAHTSAATQTGVVRVSRPAVPSSTDAGAQGNAPAPVLQTHGGSSAVTQAEGASKRHVPSPASTPSVSSFTPSGGSSGVTQAENASKQGTPQYGKTEAGYQMVEKVYDIARQRQVRERGVRHCQAVIGKGRDIRHWQTATSMEEKCNLPDSDL